MFRAFAVWLFRPSLLWVAGLIFGPALVPWIRRGFSGRWCLARLQDSFHDARGQILLSLVGVLIGSSEVGRFLLFVFKPEPEGGQNYGV
jgi:hypothetical protein